MHLPIATTRNRGLGLIPPINKRIIVTPATEREHIFPTQYKLNRNKIHSTPVEIQLHSTPVSNQMKIEREFKLDVHNIDLMHNYGLKSGRIRAVTIL